MKIRRRGRKLLSFMLAFVLALSSLATIGTLPVNAAPQGQNPGDLLITEIVPYAKANSGVFQEFAYFEVYNNSQSVIDITQYTVEYLKKGNAADTKDLSLKTVTGPSGVDKTLDPGESVIITNYKDYSIFLTGASANLGITITNPGKVINVGSFDNFISTNATPVTGYFRIKHTGSNTLINQVQYAVGATEADGDAKYQKAITYKINGIDPANSIKLAIDQPLSPWVVDSQQTIPTGIDPQVSAIAPANGSTNVPLYVNPTISFNTNVKVDPIAADSVNTSTIYLAKDAAGTTGIVSATVNYSNKIVTIIPDAMLEENTTYYIIIKNSIVAAADSLAPSTDYPAYSFVTGVTDTVAPTVQSISPANGAAGVLLNVYPTVTFSKNIKPSSVDNNSVYLSTDLAGMNKIASTVSCTNNVATITPNQILSSVTTYYINVTDAVRDFSGNSLDTSSYQVKNSFTTAQAPEIIGKAINTIPINVSDLNAIPKSAKLGILFSKTMPSSIVAGSIKVKKTSDMSDVTTTITRNSTDNRLIEISNLSGLTVGTSYTVIVYGSILDATGVAKGADESFTFTLANDPLVSSASPTNGATGVAVSTVPYLIFSRDMLQSSVENTSNIKLQVYDGSVYYDTSFTLGYIAAEKKLQIIPNSSLYSGYQYKILLVNANIKDTYNIALSSSNPTSYTFTVAGITDSAPLTPTPTVVNTTSVTAAASGATGVSRTAPIKISFNKPIDKTTINSIVAAGIGSPYPPIFIATGTSLYNGRIAATVTINSAGTLATITPSTPLNASAQYTVCVYGMTAGASYPTVTGGCLRATSGAKLSSNFSVSFTTSSGPAVTANDISNVITGIDNTMDYNLDGAGYITYGGETLDLTGNHVVYVKTTGAPDANATGLVFTTNPAAPVASAVAVTGTAQVGQLLTGSYSYSDVNLDAEAGTIKRWIICDTINGTYTPISGATGITYTPVAANEGKYIKYEVTPKNIETPTTGTATTSDPLLILPKDGTAPTVSNVSITGSPILVGTLLTGSYTFADVDDDLEGASLYRWLSSDNPADGFTAIAGATEKTYTLKSTDIGNYIKFEVTPVAKSGNPKAGMLAESAVTERVADLPVAPVAQNVQLNGNPYIGETLTGSYEYLDANADLESGTTTSWLISSTINGQYDIIIGQNGSTYVIQPEDLGKFIKFQVTVRTTVAPTDGISAETTPVKIVTVPAAPVAQNVKITGVPTLDKILTGSYDYLDANGDLQGTSTFSWLISNTEDGIYTPIPGKTGKNYTVSDSDYGKYIKFEVNPVAQTGTPLIGQTVQSNPVRIQSLISDVRQYADNTIVKVAGIVTFKTADGKGFYIQDNTGGLKIAEFNSSTIEAISKQVSTGDEILIQGMLKGSTTNAGLGGTCTLISVLSTNNAISYKIVPLTSIIEQLSTNEPYESSLVQLNGLMVKDYNAGTITFTDGTHIIATADMNNYITTVPSGFKVGSTVNVKGILIQGTDNKYHIHVINSATDIQVGPTIQVNGIIYSGEILESYTIDVTTSAGTLNVLLDGNPANNGDIVGEGTHTLRVEGTYNGVTSAREISFTVDSTPDFSIAKARTQLDQYAKIQAVVVCKKASNEFVVNDGTAGIVVHSAEGTSTLNLGDKVLVTGIVRVDSDLYIKIKDNVTITKQASGQPTPVAEQINVTQYINQSSRQYESKLISLTDVRVEMNINSPSYLFRIYDNSGTNGAEVSVKDFQSIGSDFKTGDRVNITAIGCYNPLDNFNGIYIVNIEKTPLQKALDAIEALPQSSAITLTNKPAVEAARALVTAANDNAAITNLQKLVDCETKIKTLDALALVNDNVTIPNTATPGSNLITLPVIGGVVFTVTGIASDYVNADGTLKAIPTYTQGEQATVITITATVDTISSTKTAVVTITPAEQTAQEKVAAALPQIPATATVLNTATVGSGLIALPTAEGVTFTMTATASDYVNADGTLKAVPTFVQGDQTLQVTVTATAGNYSDSKIVTVTIKAAEQTVQEKVAAALVQIPATATIVSTTSIGSSLVALPTIDGISFTASTTASDFVNANATLKAIPTEAQGNQTVQVTVTATAEGYSNSKTVTVTIQAMLLSNEERVAATLAQIPATATVQNTAAIGSSLVVLPTVQGVSTSATATASAFVNANATLKAIPTATQGDQTVLVTVTATAGGYSNSKTVTVTIKAAEQTAQEKVTAALAQIPAAAIVASTTPIGSNLVVLPTVTGISFTTSATASTYVNANATLKAVPTLAQGDQIVQVSVTATAGGYSNSKTVTVTIKAAEQTAQEKVTAALAQIPATAIVASTTTIGSSLVILPTVQGVSLSATATASTFANANATLKAIPTATQGDQTVLVTVTATASGYTNSKIVTVTIKAAIINNAEKVAATLAQIPVTATVPNTAIVGSSLIALPTVDGVTLTLAASASEFVNANGTLKAIPTAAQGDQTVQLTVRAAAGDASNSKIVAVTIKAISSTSTLVKVEKVGAIDKLSYGSDGKVALTVTNLDNASKEVTIIVALYNSKNEIVKYVAIRQTIAAGKAVNITASIRLPKLGDYTVKCFAWDNQTNKNILSNVVEIPVK